MIVIIRNDVIMNIDKQNLEQIVSDTMSANADLEGIIICDVGGTVLFGHTLSSNINHEDAANHAIQIAVNSSRVSISLEKGNLREVSISSDNGFIIILGDTKLILVGIAGNGARESMGLLRMALKKTLLKIVG